MISVRKQKRRPHAALAVDQLRAGGDAFVRVAGSARRWVAPVNDHHWSHLDISNERAKQICPAVDAESPVNCNQIDSALAIYFEG